MPSGVYKRTKEYRKKMSLAQKKRYENEEERKKTSLAMMGREFSKEHRKKLSIARKGKYYPGTGFQKGHEVSKEVRNKISEANKGRKVSKETRRKLSKSMKGSKHPLWGKRHTEETRDKIRTTKINQYKDNPELINKISNSVKKLWQNEDYIGKHCGKNNPNWKGGLTKREETLAHALRVELKNWAKQILERDNYTCQRCGMRSYGSKLEKRRIMEVHHVKSISKHPYLVLDELNGITLCKDCHCKTESYGKKLKR